MSRFITNIFSFALPAVMAGAAAAQAAQQARFHLPFEAKWGGVTLPPGDYRLALPQLSLGANQFLVNGEEARGFIAPMSTDVDSSRFAHPEHSYLRLVKVDGTFYVAKFESGPSGTTFTFKVPKPSHQVEMASQEVVNLSLSGD